MLLTAKDCMCFIKVVRNRYVFSLSICSASHLRSTTPSPCVLQQGPEGHYEGVINLIFLNIVAMCRLNKLLGLAYFYISIYVLSCRSHI